LFSEKETNFFAKNSHYTAGNKNGVVIRESNNKASFYKWKDPINYKVLRLV